MNTWDAWLNASTYVVVVNYITDKNRRRCTIVINDTIEHRFGFSINNVEQLREVLKNV